MSEMQNLMKSKEKKNVLPSEEVINNMTILFIIHRSIPVSTQSGATYHFENTFVPLNGENILELYDCQEGCSRCCEPKSFIAFTDTRLIACKQGPHIDTVIYLRDIEVLKESGKKRQELCIALLISCITDTCICFLLGGSRCDDRPTVIAVQGGFGSELLTFKKPDAIIYTKSVQSTVAL